MFQPSPSMYTRRHATNRVFHQIATTFHNKASHAHQTRRRLLGQLHVKDVARVPPRLRRPSKLKHVYLPTKLWHVRVTCTRGDIKNIYIEVTSQKAPVGDVRCPQPTVPTRGHHHKHNERPTTFFDGIASRYCTYVTRSIKTSSRSVSLAALTSRKKTFTFLH